MKWDSLVGWARPADADAPSPLPAFRAGRWIRVRALSMAALLAVLFALLIHRAWVLQVREAERLKQMAEDQYLQAVEIPPKRGRILDRHGVELAASAEVDSVHANGRLLVAQGRVEETARALAPALHVDAKELERRLRERRYFTWLKRRVTPEEARAVRELALPGVAIDREPRRWYPQRSLAGTLVGWAGLDSVGQEGLELVYDRELRGARAQVPGLRDALGRAVLTGGLGDIGDTAGHDLHTSIDRFIQYRLERALEKGVAAHRAKGGVAVALDPKTGEILAMASLPSVDPNSPNQKGGARNKAVTDPFEPGSTIKTFSIASALEPGLVRPDESWYCENGRWQVGPATIHDAEKIGTVTTTQVLAESSNICTAKIAFRAGKERLREMLVRFGFGKPTGIDLPGERAGNIRALPRMGPVETATTSFGQGMTATPLQVAAAYAAVANGGVWVKPHVMRRITDGTGAVEREAQPEERRVISPELAKTMRAMLRAVALEGTAKNLALPGYSFAGKTGTAQKVDPVTRHYSTDKWASSFVGFAPAEDARLVLFVMIDEPAGTHYGSQVAGPVWQETMIDALRWLGVPTDQPISAKEEKALDGKSPTPPPAVAAAKSAPTPVAPVESGFVATDEEGAGELPDFVGMSLAEAAAAARRANVRLEIAGSGVVVSQSPGPGEPRARTCRLQLAPPG
jgi:cell division protein FtsI (penicillin-binding protein 3)